MSSRMRRVGAALLIAMIGSVLATLMLMITPAAIAAVPTGANAGGEGLSMGLLAAAIATAVSSAGAGFAVAKVGSAAVGALAEKPELFGRLLIFVGLAEGIAIYGLIISILVLNRLA